MNTRGTNEHSVTIELPNSKSDAYLTRPSLRSVPYELVDRFGMRRGRFETAAEAADAAMRIWPDQQQDPERTGKGWDVQVAGAE